MNRVFRLLVAGSLAYALAGCGSDDGAAAEKSLTVLAASSLKEVFGTLATQFEADHPGVRVTLVLDSSATLAQMAEEGAPGDILATADAKTMDEAEAADGVTGTPEQFATNVMVLATPRDNDTVGGIADLAKGSYVVCVPTAPCGAAAASLLAANHVTTKPASEEVDVKAVLQKLLSDNADAGLVYATDVKAADGAVKAHQIPGAAESPNTYWIAQTTHAKATGLAAEWLDLVGSARGQRLLEDAGFGLP